MKIWEKILIIAIIALCGVIAGFGWGYSKMYVKCSEKEPTVVYVPKEKVIHDTITDIQYKNRYVYRYDTTYLQCIDTLFMTDTVEVLVPIERKSFDTITADSIHVYGSISGYKANIDTLTVEAKTVQNNIIINQPEERKFHWGWGIAIGFGWVK
jgi:hypothetical protein